MAELPLCWDNMHIPYYSNLTWHINMDSGNFELVAKETYKNTSEHLFVISMN